MEKVSKDGMRCQKIKYIIKKLGVKRQGTKVRCQRLVYFLGKQRTLCSGLSYCHNAASGARGHCAPHKRPSPRPFVNNKHAVHALCIPAQTRNTNALTGHACVIPGTTHTRIQYNRGTGHNNPKMTNSYHNQG
jgi:hypothetical protein